MKGDKDKLYGEDGLLNEREFKKKGDQAFLFMLDEWIKKDRDEHLEHMVLPAKMKGAGDYVILRCLVESLERDDLDTSRFC